MPTPQEMAKLIAGGPGKTGVGAPPPPPGQGGGPVGAPMTTPQPNEGEQQAANVDISMAMDLLEKSLMAFGSESDQGKTLLTCLTGLSKTFGAQRPKSQSLVPAELKQLMSSLPQGGGGTPEMKAMGAPGGAPPGAGAPPMPMAA